MAFPAPTVLAGVAPYFKGTTSRLIWVPTIANVATPTSAEITAGKDISAQVAAINGFEESTATADVNRLGSSFTGSTPARSSVGDSSVQFLLASAGPTSTSDPRSFLTPNTLGYLCFANEGFTTGMSMDIWSVRIGSYSPTQDLESNAMLTVPFFPWTAPTFNVVIPTT